MRIMGGSLQMTIDSFDKTRQHDERYIKKFIDEKVAPVLAAFMCVQISPTDITWDHTCGHFNYEPHPSARLKLYPEDTKPDAPNREKELAQL
jgi:hypothetical protein